MNQKEIARTFLCRNLQLTTTDTSSVLTASRIPPVRNSSYKKKKKKKQGKKEVRIGFFSGNRKREKVLNDTILNKDGKFFLVYYCNCGAFNIRTFQESSLSIFRYRRVLSAFPFTRPEAKQIYSDMCTHAKYVYVCMDAY